MPPAYSNRNLTADQIAILKRWIEEGGSLLQALGLRAAQTAGGADPSRTASWVKQPIDAFVYQRLEAGRTAAQPRR